jgi:pimeloyl-ACP methyl ester carboxylesterase
MADLGSRSYWQQWRSVQCPALVILGEQGIFPPAHGEQIVSQLPKSKLAVVAGAGHDLHLDAPQEWGSSIHEVHDRLISPHPARQPGCVIEVSYGSAV